MTYAVEFRFPEGACYAGMYKGALGFAPTIRTALLFDDPADAQRTAENGYGTIGQWAYVVPVKAVPA